MLFKKGKNTTKKLHDSSKLKTEYSYTNKLFMLLLSLMNVTNFVQTNPQIFIGYTVPNNIFERPPNIP